LSTAASSQIPGKRTHRFFFDWPSLEVAGNMRAIYCKLSYKVNRKVKEKLQFAERLRSLRDQQKLSNAELGKAVGLSHVSIGNFLDGQLPKSEHLAALAAHFGVTTDWLLGRDKDSAVPALRETAPEYLLDDALAELEDLKEKVLSLERALRRLKQGRAGAGGASAESDRKTRS
jgi:transcriptional regulator with XRE-family HTH domain